MRNARENVIHKAAIGQKTFDILRKELCLPSDQMIVLRYMSGEFGSFKFMGQTIHIDYRRPSDFAFIVTLCHESVHAEQYYTNRMKFCIDRNGSFILYDGVKYLYEDDNLTSTRTPWEKDAYAKQYRLAKLVWEQITGGRIDV